MLETNQYPVMTCSTLCEKCSNTEFFLVRIQIIRIRKNSVFGHVSDSADLGELDPGNVFLPPSQYFTVEAIPHENVRKPLAY